LTSELGAPAPRSGLVRNAFHLGIGQVLTTVLTMLLTAAVARTLGSADYGLLYLLTSISNFAYVFVDWGHGSYVTREVARRPDRSGELLGSVLAVRLVTAVIMCLIVVTLTWALGYDVRTRMLAAYMVLAQLPVYLGLTFAWVFRGRERMDYDALLNVVLKVATLTLALTCLALGGRLIALIASYSTAGAITLMLAFAMYHRLKFPSLQASRSTGVELMRDGAPMLAIALAVAVQPYIDANILYKLAPVEVVGWYGASWGIAGTLVAPATILAASMFPRLSRAAADRQEFTRALRVGFRPLLLVAILAGTGTYVFADVAISVVYSRQKFGPAASILRAFAPALVLIYIDMLFGNAIIAAGKAGQLAKVKGVAVVVTTALELILIQWFQVHYSNGGIGIVLAIAGGELIMVAGAVFLIRDIVTIGMATDFLRGAASGGATILVMRSLPDITPFIAIPLCVALYLVLSAAAGLVRRTDLDLLMATLRRRSAPVTENTAG
jgi:O-antigen/teichoic acid export membrane protein